MAIIKTFISADLLLGCLPEPVSFTETQLWNWSKRANSPFQSIRSAGQKSAPLYSAEQFREWFGKTFKLTPCLVAEFNEKLDRLLAAARDHT